MSHLKCLSLYSFIAIISYHIDLVSLRIIISSLGLLLCHHNNIFILLETVCVSYGYSSTTTVASDTSCDYKWSSLTLTLPVTVDSIYTSHNIVNSSSSSLLYVLIKLLLPFLLISCIDNRKSTNTFPNGTCCLEEVFTLSPIHSKWGS